MATSFRDQEKKNSNLCDFFLQVCLQEAGKNCTSHWFQARNVDYRVVLTRSMKEQKKQIDEGSRAQKDSLMSRDGLAVDRKLTILGADDCEGETLWLLSLIV